MVPIHPRPYPETRAEHTAALGQCTRTGAAGAIRPYRRYTKRQTLGHG